MARVFDWRNSAPCFSPFLTMGFPIVNPVFTLPNGRKTVFWCISQHLILELIQTAVHFGTFGVLVN